MPSRIDLHDYQNRAVAFIKDKRRSFLMLEMGLGKTISTLTAITDLLQTKSIRKVLVIAPLRVANSVWVQESRKWQHTKHLVIHRVIGDQKNRLKALHHDSEVYVINRENVQWLVTHYGKKWPFDMVIVDESSSFKNATSQRFKAMKKILPFVEYMVLLTGTPSPNGLLDLWSQCYLVDYGNSLGRTMSTYKQRFFEQDYMGYSFTPRKGAQESIHILMQPYTLSMQTADYLELPDRIDLIEEIELEPKVLTAYKLFERNLFIEFEGHQVEAINAAVLANKLLQYCNGAMYVDEYKNWGELHTAKLDALAELIEQNDENILVAYNYRSDLERLQARFPDAVRLDKRDETIQAWNRGEIKLLLAHPQSAGHGINLYEGGCMTIWFSLCWSLEYYQQFNARLHRQGQTKPVRIVHLVVKDGIDERVMRVINEKDATQNRLLSALR
jgi:SNF2 family DNA or RNA helicase